jgi:hypothetical protein
MYAHERSLVKKLSGRPFALLGVNTDDDRARVQEIVRAKELNWRSFYDGPDGPICQQYHIQAFPTVFLIDHEGVIRYKRLGPPPAEELDRRLEELLDRVE